MQWVEQLPRKQYICCVFESHLSSSLFSFSMEKEMFRFVVFPCFDLGLTVPLYVNNNL